MDGGSGEGDAGGVLREVGEGEGETAAIGEAHGEERGAIGEAGRCGDELLAECHEADPVCVVGENRIGVRMEGAGVPACLGFFVVVAIDGDGADDADIGGVEGVDHFALLGAGVEVDAAAGAVEEEEEAFWICGDVGAYGEALEIIIGGPRNAGGFGRWSWGQAGALASGVMVGRSSMPRALMQKLRSWGRQPASGV